MLTKCGVVGQLLTLVDQALQLRVELIDSSLNVTSSFLPGSSLSCHVRVTKQIDVALILATDQTVQILMMKRDTLVSDVADAAIVVQIDLHLTSVVVTESVESSHTASGVGF